MDNPNEENVSMAKSFYSMMPMVKIISFLFKMETSINRVGNKINKIERGRDKWIKRVGGRVQVRIGSSMGWETDCWKGTREWVNRTNKMAIK